MRLWGKSPVFDPSKSFFFYGSNKLAINNNACGRIPMVGIKTENDHLSYNPESIKFSQADTRERGTYQQ
jgi:hypothetical protein